MSHGYQAQMAERVESERPVGGVPVPTRSSLELAAYRMPNGSTFVTLIDATEATWEAYCKELTDALRDARTNLFLAAMGTRAQDYNKAKARLDKAGGDQ